MSATRPIVRPLFVILGSLALSAAGGARAQPARTSAAATAAIERSPFLGEWELDLSRMPDTYGPPPKRVTFTFEDAGSDMWRTSVEIVGGDDSVRHAIVRYRRDGRAVPTEGDRIDGDSAAFLSPAPNVLVLCLASAHAPASVRVYTISSNGREMTESAASVDDAGAPFVRNFHFRRIR